MKYRLIVSDFDGTVLRSDRTASERTINAIKAYREAGGTFVISTGRMFKSIVNHAHVLGLDGINIPVSAMDGGVIKESVTGKTIASFAIPYEQAAQFGLECERMGCYYQVYTEDTLFVAEENDFNRGYCEISKIGMTAVGRLSDYIIKNKLPCVKVLISDKNVESYLNYFKDRYADMQFFLSHISFLDGASIKAGKGNALGILADYLGVDMSETIALGDSMNDISMVKEAALGVAMANADDRLKKVADLIAPSNDDDGVAYVIERAIKDLL